jgi:AcrR family transcriptional regulator
MSQTDVADTERERRHRILAVAREIINESGNFDLPMRELAARARLSLRAPYDLFGSKAGVTQALLMEDIETFSEQFARQRVHHPLDIIPTRLRKAIDFYKPRQPFYRALFRGGAASVANPEFDPERLRLEYIHKVCRNLSGGGYLRGDVDPLQLAWLQNDLFYSAVRHWAFNDYDIEFVYHRAAHGTALLFVGVVSDANIERMRERAELHRRKLAAMMKTSEFRALIPGEALAR